MLKSTLAGAPLVAERADAEMDDDIRAISAFLPKVYGESPAVKQAVDEVGNMTRLPHDADGITCRRAMLLFSIFKEREVAEGFRDPLAIDLHERVLPFIVPRFVKNCAQRPDQLVALSAVLSEMWAGERLGNWPR